jgi:DNA-directed RNA polymerase specialized sigma24 family protein
VVIDAARRRARRPVQELRDEHPAPDTIEARETWMWFEAVTRELPERARQALYLRYAGGLSGEEIASALGIQRRGVASFGGTASATAPMKKNQLRRTIGLAQQPFGWRRIS